jgi:hypothetical protein
MPKDVYPAQVLLAAGIFGFWLLMILLLLLGYGD